MQPCLWSQLQPAHRTVHQPHGPASHVFQWQTVRKVRSRWLPFFRDVFTSVKISKYLLQIAYCAVMKLKGEGGLSETLVKCPRVILPHSQYANHL